MRKNLRTTRILLVGMIIFMIMQGCSFFDLPLINDSVNGDQVGFIYHSKDATDNFMAFLQNPKAAPPVRSILEPGESIEITDADLFAYLWADLSEEERTQILVNPEAISIEINSSISVSINSELGRSIANGSIGLISELAVRFSFYARLDDWFKGKEVPYMYAGIESGITETVSANLAVQKLLMENDKGGVAAILHYFDMDDRFDELMAGWEAVTDASNIDIVGQRSIGNARAANGTAHLNPLFINLGETLLNGDVLVCSVPGIGSLTGTYNHAGIFCMDTYARNRNRYDRAHSVYTAQPKGLFNYDNDTEPNDLGKACLDTILLYTRQSRFAVIRPINYTATRATIATKYAREEFYDNEVEYIIPLLDAVGITNKTKNTDIAYCSQVVWHSWNRAGVNLDADNSLGNLITPSELFDSSINRFRTVTVSIFGIVISSNTTQTYVATSYVVRKMGK